MTSRTQGFGGGQWKNVVNAPAKLVTPDASPVRVTLGTLSQDGKVFTCILVGSGVDPSDPATNNYNVIGIISAVRAAGVVTISAEVILPIVNGAAVVFDADVDGDEIYLEITPPAIAGYSHAIACLDQQLA